MVPRAGLEPARVINPKDFKSFASTNSAIPAHNFCIDYFKLQATILVIFNECVIQSMCAKMLTQKQTVSLLQSCSLCKKIGGGTRTRTGDQGFADPCLTTWLCRHLLRSPFFKFFNCLDRC